MEQRIITAEDGYRALGQELSRLGIRKLLLVCGRSVRYLTGLCAFLEALPRQGVEVVRFSGFQPNPLYENVVEGVRLFREQGCDGIFAVGGGSAMDVAKCIKLYSNLDGDGENGGFLRQTPRPSHVPFLAMPTTAGTGSEATRYAVIYYQGKKQSVTSERFLPGTVVMDPSALTNLPLYQKKATMMDALCHAVESFWSVNSTEESKEYSKTALKGILEHWDGYLANTEAGNAGMLRAAFTAGRAINITQTTAGHAMCYKLTSLFGVAHGHAAILCDRVLFPWMLSHTHRCIDRRGEDYLRETLDELGRALGGTDAGSGAEELERRFASLELDIPSPTEEQLALLRESVNPDRLKNHPVALDEAAIDSLYRLILR